MLTISKDLRLQWCIVELCSYTVIIVLLLRRTMRHILVFAYFVIVVK